MELSALPSIVSSLGEVDVASDEASHTSDEEFVESTDSSPRRTQSRGQHSSGPPTHGQSEARSARKLGKQDSWTVGLDEVATELQGKGAQKKPKKMEGGKLKPLHRRSIESDGGKSISDILKVSSSATELPTAKPDLLSHVRGHSPRARAVAPLNPQTHRFHSPNMLSSPVLQQAGQAQMGTSAASSAPGGTRPGTRGLQDVLPKATKKQIGSGPFPDIEAAEETNQHAKQLNRLVAGVARAKSRFQQQRAARNRLSDPDVEAAAFGGVSLPPVKGATGPNDAQPDQPSTAPCPKTARGGHLQISGMLLLQPHEIPSTRSHSARATLHRGRTLPPKQPPLQPVQQPDVSQQQETAPQQQPDVPEPATLLIHRVVSALERSHGSMAAAWETIQASDGEEAMSSEKLVRGLVSSGVALEDGKKVAEIMWQGFGNGVFEALLDSSSSSSPCKQDDGAQDDTAAEAADDAGDDRAQVSSQPTSQRTITVSSDDFAAAFSPGGLVQTTLDAQWSSYKLSDAGGRGISPNINLSRVAHGLSNRDARTILHNKGISKSLTLALHA